MVEWIIQNLFLVSQTKTNVKIHKLKFYTYFQVAGWAIFAIGISQSIIWAIYIIWSKFDSFDMGNIKKSFEPNSDWGPADSDIKLKWISYKNDANEKRLEMIKKLNLSTWKQWLYILFGKYR